MSNCVGFTTTNSVPSIYRNSGTRPASNNSSGRARFRIPAYPGSGTSFGQLLAVEGLNNQYSVVEFSSAGALYASTRHGSSPPSNSQTIWSDSHTGWFDLVWVANATGFYISVRRAGGAWSDISPCSAVAYATVSIRIAGSFLFPNDIDAQHRIAALEVFSTALPNGASDLAGARAYLKSLCDSRAPSGLSTSIFYNNCTNHSTVHVDGSVLASNFTVTGTPTTITNDDPGFMDTIVLATSPSGAEVPTPNIPGENVVFNAPPNGAEVPTPGLMFAQVVALDVPASGASVPTPAAYFGPTTNLLLHASANGRYFENADGQPVFLFGDSCYSIITNLSDAEQDTYLNDRQARGVNCLFFSGIENEFGNNPPENTDGEPPFTGVAFQSALNPPYWARVVDFVARCAARGMLCIMNPIYIGFIDSEGWGAEVNAASTGQIQTYGAALGPLFEDLDNIIWCFFGDRNAHGTKMAALATGLQSTDARHTLYTAHYSRPTSTYDVAVPSWVTCIMLYGATNLAHVEADGGHLANAGPMFFGEGRYEHATGIDAFYVRREAWQAALSGALGGVVVGNEGIWAFDWNSLFPGLVPWTDYLDDLGLVHAAHVRRLFDTIAFHELITEAQSAAFITAGRGTYASNAWVPASRNAAGTLAVIYVPGGASITVNMALMAGLTIARWMDPTNGAFFAAAGSPLANSGTHAFVASSERGLNAAGGTDWVLVLQSQTQTVVLTTPPSGAEVPNPAGLAASFSMVFAAPPSGASVPTPSLAASFTALLDEPPSGGHVPVPSLAGQSQIVLSDPPTGASVPEPVSAFDSGHVCQLDAPPSGDFVPEPSLFSGGTAIVLGVPPSGASVFTPLIFNGVRANPVGRLRIEPGPIARLLIQPGPTARMIFSS